ncbi:Zinc finger, PMZ-type [Corchorus olitorius]|uniref:Protein FAR1-RELATED SEQUENCE n=1 Tax=Corchorus olitorius TaxID=93759 RepID=A0A1R3ICV4_9ROSI|nr:Zinc finger, PMZ-type [Corchorus olitorius]
MAETNTNASQLHRRLKFTEDDILPSSFEGMREQHITIADEQNLELMDEQIPQQDKSLNWIDPSANVIALLHSNVSQESIPKLGTRSTDKRDVDVKQHRSETRFQCLATLKVKRFEAMLGKEPKTILIDQDPAMAKALASQWPETYHRLCVWHMYQNAAKHLSDKFERFSSLAKDFSSCVYDHDEEEDFLKAWQDMIKTYNLENNTWLQRQFQLKEQWALNLLEDRRYKELQADFKDNQSKPSLPFPVEILKHAAKIYTLEVFKIFSDQLWLTWDCELYTIEATGSTTSYKVVPPGKPRHHVVTFDSSDSTISCSCKKFEFLGILCAHSLKVPSFQNFKRVPDIYILKRWTKDAKVGVVNCSYTSTRSNDPKVDVASRYKALLRWYSHLAARAAMSEQSFEMVMSDGEKTLTEIEAALKRLSMEDSLNSGGGKDASQVATDGQNQKEGKKVKGIKLKPKVKGAGKSSCRLENALEKAPTKRKRKNALERATTTRKRKNVEEVTG